MTFEFRLASGWITAATLNGSNSYLLDLFPTQSDQRPHLQPWGPPMDHKTMYPRRMRSKIYADWSQGLDGFWQFDWQFAYWTEGMVSYFETTFFNGAGSALVTVKTIRKDGTFEEYQGTMLFGNEDEFYEPSDRGLEEYILRFRGLTAV